MLGLALLAGIGFTVSLLIGELAFGAVCTAEDRDADADAVPDVYMGHHGAA